MVLVGAHTYEHPGLKNVPAVANNLNRLKKCLTDPSIWGLPEENVKVIEQPATQSEVVDAVVDAVKHATDTVLFYYVGHGLPDRPKELYLALPTSLPGRRFDTTCRFEYIADKLRHASHIPRVVVILDCCYAGTVLGTLSEGDAAEELGELAGQTLDLLPPDRAYAVLVAAESTELAAAPQGRDLTAYTETLLKCLTDGKPGGRSLLSLEALHEYIRAELRRWPLVEGEHPPGTPGLGSPRGSAGQVYIAKNRAFKQTAPTPPDPNPEPVPQESSSVADLVRDYLTKQVQKEQKTYEEHALHLVPARPVGEKRYLRLAREGHLRKLEPSEDLIALWIWNPFLISKWQSSLAFTTHGIRITLPNHYFIPYGELQGYTFEVISRTEREPVGANGGTMPRTVYDLLISGPRMKLQLAEACKISSAPKQWLEDIQAYT